MLQHIFIVLRAREKKKLWQLSLADVFISLLDIIFLIGLLYIISFYTQSRHDFVIRGLSLTIPADQPVLVMTVFFVLFALKSIAGFFISKWQYRFLYNVASRLSGEQVAQYLSGPYQDFVSIDSSVSHRKISQQPIEFAHYVLNGVQQLFSQLMLVIITTVVVLIVNPLLFPLLVLMLGPPLFITGFLIKRKLHAATLHSKKTGEKSIQHLQEALTAFVESNVYQKNNFFISRYLRFQKQLNHFLAERLAIQAMPARLMEVFAVLGLLILVVINYAVSDGHTIELVTIGALMVAAYKIIPGIVKITNMIAQVKTYAFAATGWAVEYNKASEKDSHAGSVNSIVFESVCFNFEEKKILSCFSCSLQKGDFVVVSGMSGRGKTTFINLLLGFLTPASGNIYINSNKTDTTARQHYWHNTAYIKQQAFLLHASVAENITLQENGHNEAKLQHVAAFTGVDKISNLPNGLATIVTENGRNISGGQRQRIIFARALYKDADVLVMDEPFNELDTTAESLMLRQLQQLAGTGKIIILVTHNKEAIAFGNKKILLDEQ